MARWSWIPGLPSTGSNFDLWLADPNPDNKQLGEFLLLFLVVDDGESAALLANRSDRVISLSDWVFVRENHEKQYTKLGGRTLLVKRWKLKPFDEVDTIDGDKVRRPPKNIQGELPPREFAESDIDEVADIIS